VTDGRTDRQTSHDGSDRAMQSVAQEKKDIYMETFWKLDHEQG